MTTPQAPLPLDPLAQSLEEIAMADDYAAARATGAPPPPDLVARAQSEWVILTGEKWRASCIVASHNYYVRQHLIIQRETWKRQGLSNDDIRLYEVHNVLWKIAYEKQVIGEQVFGYWTWSRDVVFEGPPLT